MVLNRLGLASWMGVAVVIGGTSGEGGTGVVGAKDTTGTGDAGPAGGEDRQPVQRTRERIKPARIPCH